MLDRWLNKQLWQNDVASPKLAFILAGCSVLVGILAVLLQRAAIEDHKKLKPAGPNNELPENTRAGNCRAVFETSVCFALSLPVLGAIQLNFQGLGIMIVATLTVFVVEYRASSNSCVKRIVDGIFKFEEPLSQHEDYHKLTQDANSRYENLHTPIVQVILLGVAQVFLYIIYVWGLYERGRPDFSDPRLYFYYYAGMFIMTAYVVARDSEEFVKSYWDNIFRRVSCCMNDDGREVLITLQSKTLGKYRRVSTHEIHLRLMMCFIVNFVGTLLILLALPLQVSHNRDPLDFVMNVVAAFFIVEMDNLCPSEEIVLHFDHLPKSHGGTNSRPSVEDVKFSNKAELGSYGSCLYINV